jgi:predicted AAA+ superfamily ATPase
MHKNTAKAWLNPANLDIPGESWHTQGMIPRAYEPLAPYVIPGKVLVIYGPRRVGKTTLLHGFLASTPLKARLLSGDDVRVQIVLGSQDAGQILGLAEGYDVLAVDEAQRVPGIGVGLKMLVDQRPDLRVIATGSSSFDLAGQVGEPLTGRKRTLELFPVAQCELLGEWNRQELRARLEEFLVYGSYPEVVTTQTRSDKIAVLDEIVGSYLLRDVLSLDGVRASRPLLQLLQLIALQVGAEVSVNELSTKTGESNKVIRRLLDLLEKAFVLVRSLPFSRNLRDEVVSAKFKYYFYDNGIRNALIQQFNPLSLRSGVEIGQLWEDFIFIERLKYRRYARIHGNTYFWRAYRSQREVDLVEERDGVLHGYECKWSPDKTVAAPPKWDEAYAATTFQIVNRDNYQDLILPPREG